MGRRTGGIFNGPSALGTISGLGDAVSDMVDMCTRNMIGSDVPVPDPSKPMSEWGTTKLATSDQARAWCQKQSAAYQKCGVNCQKYPEDTSDWANCVQKCHGVPPVNYDAEKRACEAKGLTFSWINNGCVDPAKYAGCPKGYTYFKYPDGTERCTAQTDWTDPGLLQGKCPPGSELQTVSGGKTCISIKQPVPVPTKCQTGYVLSGGKCVKKTSGTTATPPPVMTTPPPAYFQPPPQPGATTETGLLSNPLVLLAIGAVVIGGIVVVAAKKKKGKKDKAGKKVRANKSRRRQRAAKKAWRTRRRNANKGFFARLFG